MTNEIQRVIDLLEMHSGEYAEVAEAQEALRAMLFNTVSMGAQLEYQAVALVKQYRWALPAPAKDFFRKLAAFLNWNNLKKEL